ncbi:MAG TPA: hypothetical protein VGO65_03230 [Pseudolysinimonas sp.]|nr:hypothetical protein [Pseudolysinimonas sp.]
MSARKPMPEGLPAAGFRVRDARERGASRQRLERADLSAPFHGIRMRGSSASFLDRCAALEVVFPEGSAFCGSTAARLWELPLPLSASGIPFRVSSLRPTRALRRRHVIGSERGRWPAVRHHGVAVLDPVATWITLARELETHDLTAVADRLISGTLRTPPLAGRADVERALEEHGAGAGSRRLRRALADSRERAWSRPETLLRLLVGRAGLPEPQPNFETLAGGELAVIDLAWPELRVGLEYDGRWHDRTPEQWASDARRRERLADAGWSVSHVRAEDLFGSPHAVVARLARRLASAGHPTRTLDLTKLPRYEP